jgi:hypothetical protein
MTLNDFIQGRERLGLTQLRNEAGAPLGPENVFFPFCITDAGFDRFQAVLEAKIVAAVKCIGHPMLLTIQGVERRKIEEFTQMFHSADEKLGDSAYFNTMESAVYDKLQAEFGQYCGEMLVQDAYTVFNASEKTLSYQDILNYLQPEEDRTCAALKEFEADELLEMLNTVNLLEKIESIVIRNLDYSVMLDQFSACFKKLMLNDTAEKIQSWPGWKKQAYNEMFATSAHVKKIPV